MSFLSRHNDPLNALYLGHLAGRRLVISFMTVAEIEKGMLRNGWGSRRRREMHEHLSSFVEYPYDRAVCRLWAEVKCAGDRAGYSVSDADAWIAATARLLDLPLVTHDRDFTRVQGVRVITEAR